MTAENATYSRSGTWRKARLLNAFAIITALAVPGALHAQVTSTSSGQAYPAKPVRILVGFTPGAGVDIAIRLIAPRMSEALGQQIVIDNRPGAGGNIAAELTARAPADGYTLFAGGAPAAISQTLYSKLNYDLLKDLETVALIATVPNLLVVHPSLPVKNVKDLVAIAKSRRGELSYATTGSGSSPRCEASFHGSRLHWLRPKLWCRRWKRRGWKANSLWRSTC